MNQNDHSHLVVSAANAFAKYARALRDIKEEPTAEKQVALDVLRQDWRDKKVAALASKGKKQVEAWGIYFEHAGVATIWSTREEAQSCLDSINAPAGSVVVKLTGLVPL